jgi:hypothetical protein
MNASMKRKSAPAPSPSEEGKNMKYLGLALVLVLAAYVSSTTSGTIVQADGIHAIR